MSPLPQPAASADAAAASLDDPWAALRRLTPARIAQGRSGVSLPTTHQLAFQLAHARARDAVSGQLDLGVLRQGLAARGLATLELHSAAGDRPIYLQRPDQGRRLDQVSRRKLAHGEPLRLQKNPCNAAFVIADGLSAQAVQAHALPLLDALLPRLAAEHWSLAPIVLVEQGRVAIGDEIGELLQAELVVVLIGERPGLSAPDSLGIYLTWGPRIGRTDAERNCISNVRPAGQSYAEAAHTLHYLMNEARRRGLSGVMLKDETGGLPKLAAGGNFLVEAG